MEVVSRVVRSRAFSSDSRTLLSKASNLSLNGLRISSMEEELSLLKAALFSADRALNVSFMASRSFWYCSLRSASLLCSASYLSLMVASSLAFWAFREPISASFSSFSAS